MAVYRNSKDGCVVLSGKVLRLQLCRGSNVLTHTIIQSSQWKFSDIWHKIHLAEGVVPNFLSDILEKPSGNDDLMDLHNWLSKNKEVLENIYDAAKLDRVIDPKENQHLRKIN